MKKTVIPFVLLAFHTIIFAQKRYEPNWESIDSRPVPSWYEDAKFGIFIHWGLYSVPSWAPTNPDNVYEKYAEWYWYRYEEGKKAVREKQNPDNLSPEEQSQKNAGSTAQDFVRFHTENYGKDFQYQDFVSGFKAEFFQPDLWADIIKNSGAKYVVLTSKHHDGFALWPSIQSWNWNSVDVGPHRDLCGELTKSVKEKGLKMGFYYSLYEWYNPLYKADPARYVDEHMIPQMKDLVTRYEPEVLFTDGEWEHPSETWKSTQFLSWLFNESKVKNQIVIYDRWGAETRSKHGGVFTTEYDLVHDDNANTSSFGHVWEDCRGIGGSFGFNRNEQLKDYATSEKLIETLIDKVARGGNLLLNVGPTADGRIPIIFRQRLADIGEWLSVNGEAIYGSRKWSKAPAITPNTTLFFTQNKSAVYAVTTVWNDEIVVDNILSVKQVTMLGYNGKIRYSHQGTQLKIKSPSITPADNPCRYAWVFKIDG
jgi:alpha-L-fucosidase